MINHVYGGFTFLLFYFAFMMLFILVVMEFLDKGNKLA